MAAHRSSPAGAYRQQDSVVIAGVPDDKDHHAQQQWQRRAPPAWEDYSVRVAWREAEIVFAGPGFVHRHHEPSGMHLVAEWGCLQTAYREPAGGDDE